MNPIERLEAVAKWLHTAPCEWKPAEDAEKELRAIIEALKQQDEAVRKVAEEMDKSWLKYGEQWADRLRAALEGKK